MSLVLAPGFATSSHAAAAPRMAPHLYDLLDAIPETYWRYLARHRLFYDLWRDHRRPAENGGARRVLDVGCGSGGLLHYLRGREGAAIRPVGIDPFLHAVRACRRRGLQGVAAADAVRLPFIGDAFDFVVAQDVIEHVDDDRAMLAELRRVTAPGGLALIVAPAHQTLWSTRDVRLGHRRRYTVDALVQRVEEAGYTLVRRTYTDLFLYFPLWLMTKLSRRNAAGIADISADAPAADGWANRALSVYTRAEHAIARRLGLPLGVSAVVLARKPG